MLELWQAEWCPYSHRVRQRLTECGVDFVARQVPADPADRDAMREATGSESIPTLVADDGTVLEGMRPIVRWLESTFDQGADAKLHRHKAEEDVPNFTPW